ncbi:MAG: septal ring lytic transglycosylase RlpA family protein [Rickettsiales bacterium]|jgi:rare lipoprotein A (peptidoglycan hydrolase)|nr:septal ring lytic transglycosylase RlpA family protein [Rickettsiales bacterium]
MLKKILCAMVVPLALAACQDGNNAMPEEKLTGEYGAPVRMSRAGDAATQVDAAPAYLFEKAPKYFIGTEYKIDGVQYLPIEDMNYNETGIAGIIPAELNGNTTTNGEIFDNDKLMATHKTLPLPTIVKITNLDNGASVLARVNNRGPFVNSRTMDVSQAVAARLGMTGPTHVQITVQREESEALRDLTLGSSGAAVNKIDVVEDTAEGGPYSVQVGAFYSRESADAVANRIAGVGNVKVVDEGGMHKVRVVGLSAGEAKKAMKAVRSENSNPGLLENGRWINPDSI